MKKYFCALLIIFSLTSCGWVLRKLYGVGQPRLQTPESIQQYLAKKGLPLNTLTLDSSTYSPYEHNGQVTISPPFPLNFAVYNPKGYRIYINDHCDYVLLDSIRHNTYTIDTSNSLSTLKNKLNDINGNPFQEQFTTDGKNYLYVIYWTMWSGRISTDLIKTVKHYTDSTANCKLILINCDFLKRWAWTKKYSIKIDFNYN